MLNFCSNPKRLIWKFDSCEKCPRTFAQGCIIQTNGMVKYIGSGVSLSWHQCYVYPKLLSGLNNPGMLFRVKQHLPNSFWETKYIHNKMYIRVDAPIRSICFCVPSASNGWYMILHFAISTDKCICPDEVSAHFLGTRMIMDILIWLSAQCDVLFNRIFIIWSYENRS